MALAVFQHMHLVWSIAPINIATNINLFKSIVTATAIYACETWKYTTKMTEQFNVLQQRCLRKLPHVSYHHDHITNEEILQRSDSKDLLTNVNKCECSFLATFYTCPKLVQTALQWESENRPKKIFLYPACC